MIDDAVKGLPNSRPVVGFACRFNARAPSRPQQFLLKPPFSAVLLFRFPLHPPEGAREVEHGGTLARMPTVRV